MGVLYGAYSYGRHTQSQDDAVLQQRAVIAQQIKDQADVLAYAAAIKSAGEQHDKDQLTVNNLHDQLSRVRVHFPACRPMSGDTKAAVSKNRSSRVLPDAVDSLFAKLQSRTSALVERCDQLNINAIRLNADVR